MQFKIPLSTSLAAAGFAVAIPWLLAGSPAHAAVYLESHWHSGPYQFEIAGPLPQPLEIVFSFGYDVAGAPSYPRDDYEGYSVEATISNRHSLAYFAVVYTVTGFNSADTNSGPFLLTDTDRLISVGMFGQASGAYTINDISISFNLPDGLSVASIPEFAVAIPESSTWLMMLVGFLLIRVAYSQFAYTARGRECSQLERCTPVSFV